MQFEHELPEVKIISGRHPFIVNKCRGKVTLHIGCVDAGLLEERFSNGELLHQKLEAECSELWGCDIDEDGIDFLADRGYENIFVLDLEDEQRIKDIFKKKKFDVVILSEVAEHLLNPGKVLMLIAEHCLKNDSVLIFSVPNAYSAHGIWNMIKNIEFVHPDHNYYFSYVTALNLLRKCDYEVKDLYCYTFLERLLPKKIRSKLLFRSEDDDDVNDEISLKQRYWKFLNWYMLLPKKMFFKYLYSRSRYWGEGIMIVASKVK